LPIKKTVDFISRHLPALVTLAFCHHHDAVHNFFDIHQRTGVELG